ncbi:poly(3-hydroxyalkanoate) depolymerase [Rhizobiaceae bacterium]|nr:poly(3-hydroxyalkanoate) depolymerase [Rhizobiaceae bacterium]
MPNTFTDAANSAVDYATGIGTDLIDGVAPTVMVPELKRQNHDGIVIRMMEVQGQKLRVATVGLKKGVEPDGRPPLLMFNGIGANLELAFPFLKALTDTRAIIFDIPGVGGSPMPALPYRPSTIARLGKALCEQLGHDEVDVSGISWGGGMAQQFAKQYPKFCRRLILSATSAGWFMVPGKPSVLSKMASVRRYTEPGYMRTIAGEIYGGDFRKSEQPIQNHVRAVKPVSGRGYALQLLAMTGWTSVPWLWRLKQKTLVLSGTDDPLIPVANAKLLAKLIPDSELRLVDNGHLYMVTRPTEAAEICETFLRRA